MTARSPGIVVIGRNEGERLRACLESLRSVESGKWKGERADETGARCKGQGERACPIVYVDSGSSDGSVELAKSFGAEVVELDMSKPFSAARARNAGFARLRGIVPDMRHVQFIDGDCAVAPGWLEAAQGFMEANPQYAVVCGRRRERFPEASVYNRICDMEWDTPAGDAKACGGDAMMRAAAVAGVGGYDASVIAGEEPELCVRLRHAGWKIYRLDHEMTLHDAAMTRFGQWWKRAVRAGYAFALGAHLHGGPPERHWVREVHSTWFWGFLLPLLATVTAWPTRGLSLLLLAGYFALTFRVHRYMRSRRFAGPDASLYAFFCVLAKFPQAQGQFRFWWGRLMTRPSGIIEYKSQIGRPVSGDCA